MYKRSHGIIIPCPTPAIDNLNSGVRNKCRNLNITKKKISALKELSGITFDCMGVIKQNRCRENVLTNTNTCSLIKFVYFTQCFGTEAYNHKTITKKIS